MPCIQCDASRRGGCHPGGGDRCVPAGENIEVMTPDDDDTLVSCGSVPGADYSVGEVAAAVEKRIPRK